MALENRTTAAVVAGYLLGSAGDFDLAATAGEVISRLNVSASPGDLAEGLQEFVEASEKLSELSDDARDQLFEAVNNEDVQAIAELFAETEDNQDEDAQSEAENEGESEEEAEDTDEGEEEAQGEGGEESEAEDEAAGDEGEAEEEAQDDGEAEDAGEGEAAGEEPDEKEAQGEKEAPRRKKPAAKKTRKAADG